MHTAGTLQDTPPTWLQAGAPEKESNLRHVGRVDRAVCCNAGGLVGCSHHKCPLSFSHSGVAV